MSNEFLDYVEDMLDAIDKAELLVLDVTYDQFADDFRINFAVVRTLEIIGEAARRLPQHLRDDYPLIPWKGMIGMRDRVIHGYDIVDLEIVWDTVKRDLPGIRPQLQQILVAYGEAQDSDEQLG